jgi:predicted MFS family arabinose efflux permease
MTFLVLALVLDYADRMLLGALGPTLERDFHLGTTQLGLLSSAFGIVGAGAALPLGVLTDRVARTRLLALSLALWAGAEALVGGAASFALLVGLRLLLGVVAATTGPTVPSLTGDLVPHAW